MKHTISLALFLYFLWLGLSGHTSFLLLSLGAASVALTVYLSNRMDRTDRESHPISHLSRQFIPLMRFWFRLLWEIVLANLDVIKRILKPGKSVSPVMLDLPLPLETDIGRVSYANAITLTPGTVSVRLNQQFVTVHALSREAAADLASGKLAAAVPDIAEERQSAPGAGR